MVHFQPHAVRPQAVDRNQAARWPRRPDAVNLLWIWPGIRLPGTHPTTASVWNGSTASNCQAGSLIDFGCGSAFLAIAGLFTGRESVVRHDIEYCRPGGLARIKRPAAIQIAESGLTLHLPEGHCRREPADILVANNPGWPIVMAWLPSSAAGQTGGD